MQLLTPPVHAMGHGLMKPTELISSAKKRAIIFHFFLLALHAFHCLLSTVNCNQAPFAGAQQHSPPAWCCKALVSEFNHVL